MSTNSKPDLSIIIVSFNVCHLLDQCLSSIFTTKNDLNVEVIVVDNASQDETASLVQTKHSEVDLIANIDNLGFAKATNQGLEIAEAEYILLLNPDTIVLPGTLSQLLEFIKDTQDAGAVGPMLLNQDGTLQASCRSFPNFFNMAAFSFFPNAWYPKMRVPIKYLLEWWDHSKLLAVDYVLGAALMIRRNALDHVGPFDEGFFLYGEEKDWCYRANLAGYRSYFLPEAQVIHLGGQSSRSVSSAALRWLYESHSRFLHKHYRHPASLIWILRMGLLMKALASIIGAFVNVTERRLRLEKAKVYFKLFVHYPDRNDTNIRR